MLKKKKTKTKQKNVASITDKNDDDDDYLKSIFLHCLESEIVSVYAKSVTIFVKDFFHFAFVLRNNLFCFGLREKIKNKILKNNIADFKAIIINDYCF